MPSPQHGVAQSPGQLPQFSVPLHVPSPQQGAGQSATQVTQSSEPLHAPSPQQGAGQSATQLKQFSAPVQHPSPQLSMQAGSLQASSPIEQQSSPSTMAQPSAGSRQMVSPAEQQVSIATGGQPSLGHVQGSSPMSHVPSLLQRQSNGQAIAVSPGSQIMSPQSGRQSIGSVANVSVIAQHPSPGFGSQSPAGVVSLGQLQYVSPPIASQLPSPQDGSQRAKPIPVSVQASRPLHAHTGSLAQSSAPGVTKQQPSAASGTQSRQLHWVSPGSHVMFPQAWPEAGAGDSAIPIATMPKRTIDVRMVPSVRRSSPARACGP
jgi:hypothetical protein